MFRSIVFSSIEYFYFIIFKMKKILFFLCLSLFVFLWHSNAESSAAWSRCGKTWNFDTSNDVRQQINTSITEWGIWMQKWVDAYKIWDYTNALTYFKKSYEICPEAGTQENLYLTYLSLWDWYFSKVNYTSAIEYYKKALDLQSNSYEALFNIGSSYNNLSDYENALIYYKKALDVTFDATRIKEVNTSITNVQGYINSAKAYEDSRKAALDAQQKRQDIIDLRNKKQETAKKELSNAISRMYKNKLTSYNTVDEFMWEDYLTREQASKFFVLFSKNILKKTATTDVLVSLNDLKKADITLQPYISEAVQLWLFKWVKWKFLPFDKLTQAQTLAVIIRSLDWKKDETSKIWYSEYYDMANSYWILVDLWFDISSLDTTSIKRKEVALLLYRLVNNKIVK